MWTSHCVYRDATRRGNLPRGRVTGRAEDASRLRVTQPPLFTSTCMSRVPDIPGTPIPQRSDHDRWLKQTVARFCQLEHER